MKSQYYKEKNEKFKNIISDVYLYTFLCTGIFMIEINYAIECLTNNNLVGLVYLMVGILTLIAPIIFLKSDKRIIEKDMKFLEYMHKVDVIYKEMDIANLKEELGENKENKTTSNDEVSNEITLDEALKRSEKTEIELVKDDIEELKNQVELLNRFMQSHLDDEAIKESEKAEETEKQDGR